MHILPYLDGAFMHGLRSALLLLMPLCACAQNAPFAWSYAMPSDTSNGTGDCAVIPAANGEMLLLSQISMVNQVTRRQIHRVAADGTLLWRRRIDAPAGSWPTYTMRRLPDASLALAGALYSNVGLYLHLDSNAVPISAVKFEADGFRLSDVRPVNDSLVLLAGMVVDGASSHAWHGIAKADGTVLNAWRSTMSGLNTYFTGVRPMPTGGFLLTGYTQTANQLSDVVLARTDANGTMLWMHQLARGTDRYTPVGSMELPNGDLLVCANEFMAPLSYTGSLLVTRLDPSGTPLWSTKITASGSNSNLLPDRMALENDTTFLLTGRIKDPSIKLGLIRIDQNGTVLASSIHPLQGGLSDAAVVNAPDVDVALAGFGNGGTLATTHLHLDSTLAWCTSTPMTIVTDTATVALNTLSTTVPDVSWTATDVLPLFSSVLETPLITDPCLSTLLPGSKQPEQLPRFAPSPANSSTTLLLPSISTWSCVVIDTAGRRVRTVLGHSSDRMELSTADLPSGTYNVLAASGEDGSSLSLRLVVIH